VAKVSIITLERAPGGLQFVNFRGASPTYTSAIDSTVLDEAELWRSALGAPAYRSPVI